MDDIYKFFNKLKDEKLKSIYEKDQQEITEMIERIYKCCFRFNLTVNQTKYMLEEALGPFIGTWIEEK